MEKVTGVLLWVWFLCWIGLFLGFPVLVFEEYGTVLSLSRAGAHFSLGFLVTTVLLWILYFVCDTKAKSKVGKARQESAKFPADKADWEGLFLLSTLGGSILAIYTAMGIAFFIFVAPRVH